MILLSNLDQGLAAGAKYFEGIADKATLKEWSDYAKGNSYRPHRAALKHDIGTEGCDQDIKGDWSKDDWRGPQADYREGRGRAPINPAAKPNTTTGSKRD